MSHPKRRKAHPHKQLSLVEFFQRFPDNASAERWFTARRWPEGAACPHCGSTNVQHPIRHHSMTHRCREKECAKRFSPRTGTLMERSHLGYLIWLFAMFLMVTSLNGISSMELHRRLKVSVKTAWYLSHRIRRALEDDDPLFTSTIEIDETFFGGIRSKMQAKRRKAMAHLGRGTAGKTPVIGAKDRRTNRVHACVIGNTDAASLQGFIAEQVAPGARVITDEAAGYEGIPFTHETVNHGRGEYVRGDAHTNGIESFWAMVKRAWKGTYYKMSPKHLDRYIVEFGGRLGLRDLDTLEQLADMAAAMVGKSLTYKELTAPNGRDSGARAVAVV